MNLSTLRKKVAGISVIALVAGLFATGVATAQTANIFSDVPADAWFNPYVNGLAESGVIDSTSDMYRPGDLVNRAEMAKFAFMVSGLPMETATAAPYKDVAMGQWYTDYVYTLTKNNIVSGDKLDGVPTGYFRPSDNLNRAEAAKMLVNSAQMAEDLSGAPHFPDVTTAHWFHNYVETMFNNAVVAGYPDGYFRPANNINRAEAAKMVYLSMNPVVAGFVLDSAAAASKTKVELIFSMNVDETLAADVDNYTIEDSNGNDLSISDVEVVAADTVHLTTGTQTQGKVYYVTVKNIESDAGDSLANTDSVSFLGYGADVSGGALEVALSTQTPVAGSIPQGATGVVFTCWDFMGGTDSSVVKSLRVHRVGPGSEDAFKDVYLYRGDVRLTTGRSINNETQTAEFNNINEEVDAGENVKICLIADLTTTASGGVHAFELESADDVMTNSSDLTGSFPLRGADQLITSATVGTSTVKKNGSLDEVTIGETGARIAQFEIEAGSEEDQLVQRLALYVRGSVNVSDITNLKLYVEGESEVLATASGVGAKDLATLILDSPYEIEAGQTKIFYVTADVETARNGDDVKVYLDESTDVLITGATYGYGTQVDITAYDGGDADGTSGTTDDEYSYVLLKGSKFTIGFNGPDASDIAVNQNQARCMDLTITNAAGLDVTIEDWVVQLDATGAEGLLKAGPPIEGNYTQIKLVRLNEDGSVSGTLLGSAELNTAGSDATQTVTLKGNATVSSGESIKAAVVFDVANNTALNGDSIQCSLLPVTGADQVKDANNDPLGASNITPSSTIAGNIHSVVSAALTFTKSSSPSNGTKLANGTSNATLLAFQAKAGSSLDTTIKSLAFTADVVGWDCNGDGDTVDAAVCDETVLLVDINGDGDQLDVAENETNPGTIDVKDYMDSLGIYDDSDQLISDLKSLPASAAGQNSGVVTFNNLNIKILSSATMDLYIKGNVSNSIAIPRLAETSLSGLPLVLDQNGQTVTGVDITAVDGTTPPTDLLQLLLGSSPTVTPTVTAANDPKIFVEEQEEPVFAFTLKSTDGTSTLQDMIVKVNTTNVQLPVDKAALYKASSSGECSTATMLKDFESIVATSATTGYVEFTNVGESLSDSQNEFFCVLLKAKEVVSGQPISNSDISLNTAADAGVPGDVAGASIIFSKVLNQSGGPANVTANITTAPTASIFFMGVPTFANQGNGTVLSNGASLDVLNFTAGSQGTINSLNELAVTFEGVAPATCDLYRGSTNLDIAPVAPAGGVVTFTSANFTGGVATSWNNGSTYSVKCTYAGVLSGDSSKAKLAPITAANTAAIIWDDGNGATLTAADAGGFGLVDSVLFLDNVEGDQLDASF